MELIIQLIAGAVGGTAAGKVLQQYSLGTAGNAVAGLVGGGLGGQLLGMAGIATTGTDITAIIGQIAGGGVGGAVLMVIAGIVKGMMARKA